MAAFVANLKGHIRFSAAPKFDPFLVALGSTVTKANEEAIKIGVTALIRDSELFKTIFHEEAHLRLIGKARRGSQHALEMVTNPDAFMEEDYAERIAIRYWQRYEKAFGQFKH